MIIGKAPNQIPEFLSECKSQGISYSDIYLPVGLSAQVAWSLYRLSHKVRRRILRKANRSIVKKLGYDNVNKEGALNETLSIMLGIARTGKLR